MLGIGMAGIRRVHLHLRSIRCHPLRHSHIWATRGLLYHHRSTHSVLRIHKLRSSWVGTHMRLGGSLIHVELRHRLAESQLCMRPHWGWVRNVAVLKSGRGENLRRGRRHLHPVMVIEVRCGSVMLRMQMVRAVRWARGRWNTLASLLEMEWKLMLVRRLRVRCNATLRRDRWHSDRRLEHIGVELLLVTGGDIPRRRCLIWWRNSTIERVILISLLRTLFLHPLDRVELVVERWPLRSRQWLLRTEKRCWAGGAGY